MRTIRIKSYSLNLYLRAETRISNLLQALWVSNKYLDGNLDQIKTLAAKGCT